MGISYFSANSLILLGEMELNSIIAYILLTIFKIFIRCILAMIFLVIIDYAFQKWDFEKRMKMTKKEIKDELKRTEGDPLVKSRIRSIQMQMARKRMMQEVPRADVVITNPTDLAVALKYDSSVMEAPKLLAKGSARIAKRIKELAEKYDIPIGFGIYLQIERLCRGQPLTFDIRRWLIKCQFLIPLFSFLSFLSL